MPVAAEAPGPDATYSSSRTTGLGVVNSS